MMGNPNLRMTGQQKMGRPPARLGLAGLQTGLLSGAPQP
jgi:hypothetical protein